MPKQITITDDDINLAETILIPAGEHFDDERQLFIKNLTTIDLQACPGSGKTTCLLAKLLILSRHLPLKNNRGILILSHSNAAVNEIKDNLIKYCPLLFEYPNFVGTIQGFVDQFLAIPYYQQQYNRLPYRIDDEIFNEKVWIPRNAQGWLGNKPNKEEIIKNLRFDNAGKITSITKLPNDTTDTYKALFKMRKKILDDGYLCFDDAFYLGEIYINTFPKIINLIQNRFAYIFIDEMQDTDDRQLSILDKLFPANGLTIIQRIGDQNQAIYSWRVKADNIWSPQSGHLMLNGSKRLSANIASAIKNISLMPQDLIGNAQRQNIKPKIILYDDSTIKNVPKKFGDTIIDLNLHQENPPVFKAIGWRKVSSDSGGLCIGSYFDNYHEVKGKNIVDFDSLDQYLNIDVNSIYKLGLNVPRKNILIAILKVLRILDLKTDETKNFTISSFLNLLRTSYVEKYEELKRYLYKWSLAIYKHEQVHDEIRDYILNLIKVVFSINTDRTPQSISSFFIDTGSHETENESTLDVPINVYHHEREGKAVNIEIGTIHSVKGETHTATLYLETFYCNDGGKSYESQRLINQLKGNRVDNCGVRVKESLKMAYVGMSRPTTLLCVAIHKSRIPSSEIIQLQNNWDIMDITVN
ncbi:ATP-dependent helicase [Candidatus Amesbacteria bacterium]|nr:ATP-dependent helicase [Candidatus Amesbacteria bacterium]